MRMTIVTFGTFVTSVTTQIFNFAGSHYSNLTQALSVLKPPPSKFKKGDTVKFKDTKKNVRWQRAGKIGVVITDLASTDHWCVVEPNGTKHTYCGVRDIGLL